MAFNEKIGAIWIKTSKKGVTYMSGSISMGVLGNVRFVAFPNDKVESDRHPAYHMYKSKPPEEHEADTGDASGEDAPF